MVDGMDNVLVLIRGALGDVLIARSFLAALPRHFGARGVSLAGNPPALEVLKRLPSVTTVRNQDRAEWAGLYMDPPNVPDRLAEFILGHKTGVVLSRRPESDPAASGLRAIGLDPVIAWPSAPPEGLRVHVEDFLFSESGITPPPAPTVIEPFDEDRREAASFLKGRGLVPGQFATLHPGSGGMGKNWPLYNWMNLGRMVRDRTILEPLYFLGPAESESAGRFGEPHKAAIGLPLPVLAAVMQLGRGHVGHDTGITHLAAAFGVPAVAVFGPTDPAVWAPRGPKTRIIAPPGGFDPARPWDWLVPERVMEEFERLLLGLSPPQ